ncbi:methylmalonyl-CoA mutase [Salsuginibacillus halophilus]|uniref:Methylmalonyl-CoA mutase n=1 Tax=Salsuginibacillus halophilus TaxID=517424 RepID=A0A2P8HXN6_9BACI|nr:methylmalonyl-CoA mutase subunit beta [Salsuginibacillus halophilus]PSL50968.1 methylmalonyl-CoA mutase [Salsuginibacillus halophilus]
MEQTSFLERLSSICNFPVPSDEDWKKAAEAGLKGGTVEEKLFTSTYEGIDLAPIYRRTSEDMHHRPEVIRAVWQQSKVHPSWETAQEIFALTPEGFAEEAAHDTAKGQHVVKVPLAPSVRGSSVKGGEDGLYVNDIEDVKTAIKGVAPDVALIIHAGSRIKPVYAQFQAAFEQLNRPLFGTLAADPIGELAACGKLGHQLETAFAELAETTQSVCEKKQHLRTVLVSSSAYHEAGASAVQELAAMLATGVTYLRELTQRGLEVDEAASHFSFEMPSGKQHFMEMAKFRAFRLLWTRVLEAFGAEQKQAYIHACTSRWTKSVYDPYNNMLRASAEAFAAVIGGADSLHVSPFDETFQVPSRFSRRVARNTQLIFQEESYLTSVQDASGGAYYVDQLTDELSVKAWRAFQEIEEAGGIIQSLEAGTLQEDIEATARQKRENIYTRKERFVGINQYPDLSGVDPEIPRAEAEKAAAPNIVKTGISPADDQVKSFVEAAKAGASFKDLQSVVNPDEVTVSPVKSWRGPAPFETLRKAVDQHRTAENADRKTNVHLLTFGALKDYKPRADFGRGVFETAGLTVTTAGELNTLEDALAAVEAAEADTFVICGADQDIETVVDETAKVLQEKYPSAHLAVCGKLGEEQHLNGRLKQGMDVYRYLHDLLTSHGVTINDES